MRSSICFVTLVTVLLLVGCSAPTTPAATATATAASMTMPADQGTASGTYSKLVGPAEFAAAIATSGTVTINVHVPFIGKIAGTNLMIPYTDISQQGQKLPADHHTELAIYCRTGVMSAIAAKTLAALGYSNVVELRGGMYAWEATGRTLLSAP